MVRPNQNQIYTKRQKHKRTGKLLKLFLFVCILGLVFLFLDRRISEPQTKTDQTVSTNIPPKEKSSTFKTFTGKQFEDLYNSFAYPNTQLISEEAPITGNLKADARIRQLALERGYRLRSAPVTDTFVTVQKGMVLQQRAADAWVNLKNRAKKDGFDLKLTAAYRSAADEKDIFLSRLHAISLTAIAESKADNQVNKVLEHTAVPGYSRHHTGYTVDIACASNPGVKFEQSSCFRWLKKDNYLNAKKSGWIPSYPDGAGKQGPEPEPWEYVWVGTDALR